MPLDLSIILFKMLWDLMTQNVRASIPGRLTIELLSAFDYSVELYLVNLATLMFQMRRQVNKIRFCLFVPKSKNICELRWWRQTHKCCIVLPGRREEWTKSILRAFQEFLNFSGRNGHVQHFGIKKQFITKLLAGFSTSLTNEGYSN